MGNGTLRRELLESKNAAISLYVISRAFKTKSIAVPWLRWRSHESEFPQLEHSVITAPRFFSLTITARLDFLGCVWKRFSFLR